MPKFCPMCGKQLAFEEAEVCPGCGVRIKAPPIKKPSAGSGDKVLLIIAIIGVVFVVILIGAAVTAAFVFGMAGNIQKTKVVAATAYSQGDTIIITYQGGLDSTLVSELTYGIGSSDHIWSSPQIGDTRILSGSPSAKDHVIVSAHFSDGSEQVILDTYV
jgi:archaeal type IV pilus assembly protein PilA